MDGNDATIMCPDRKLTPGYTGFLSPPLRNKAFTCLVSEKPNFRKHKTTIILLMRALAKFHELTVM
jgi:hypothetical protein